MSIRKVFAVLFIIIMITCIMLTGCNNNKTTKIKLCEVTHSIFYAPQYVAIHNGYFEEQGIKVELINGAGADKTMTAVLSNSADIGLMGPEAAIYVYNEGKEDHALIFAQLTQRDGSFLMGRTTQSDFKWEDLKGKTVIGGRKGGVPEMTLEYVIKKHGLTPGKDIDVLTNIQFALMAGAFKGGTGDYVTLFEPTASMIENEGIGYIVASVGKEAGEIPYTSYMAKKSYIEKNKELIKKFTKALYKGQQFVATQSPDKIAEAIKPAFPDSNEELLIQVIKRYKDQDTWRTSLKQDEESFNRLQDVMEMAGELDKRVNFADITTNKFVKDIDK